MKIAVLNAAYDHSESPFKEFDPEPDPTLYLPEDVCELHHIHKATAVAQIRDLVASGQYDVFINLCDGAWDEDRAGIEVVQTLEKLGAAYTGADEYFYEPTREMMKLVAAAWGVSAPGFVMVSSLKDCEYALENLSFPMIVKHPNSYGSIGLTKKCRVENAEDLRTQTSEMLGKFGTAMIEEFIEGREYTVLIAENTDEPLNPFALEPVEYIFPAGETFKHFDLKWIEFEGMNIAHCEDPALALRLKDISKKIFVGLNGKGYGRTDIRVDKNGEAWLLEINPNPSIFYPEPEFGSADNVLKFDEEGHRGFLRKIIKSALYHQKRRRNKYKLLFSRKTQYGLYASGDIKSGEVIIPLEQQPQNLVTKGFANKNWNEVEKAWFESYATPVTDEVWMTWSNKPNEWRPTNHSCDPNAWLTGLDVTARRNIPDGEQITLDYATFCNEQMKSFECACGSPDCRKVIYGDDYLKDFVEKYGVHVSDYVRQRRKVIV